MPKRQLLFLFILSFIELYLVSCAGTPSGSSSPDRLEKPSQTALSTSEKLPPPTDSATTMVAVDVDEPDEVDTASTSVALQALAKDLESLSLQDFYEVSFRALTMRSPETVVTIGLTDLYGVDEVLLDDISDAYRRETYRILALVLQKLESYDRQALSPEDAISYDVYRWFLQDEIAAQEYLYHDYLATYYPITAVHEDTLRFFTDIHPIRSVQDARDYVTRLALIDEKIYQLIDNLEVRSEAGIQPPQFAIEWAVYGSLGQFVSTPAQSTGLYLTLEEKMLPLSSGTPQEMQDLLAEAETIIQTQVLPAYQALQAYLISMDTFSGGDSGVWRLPQGEAYYTYKLRHFTTTDLSAEEIHQIGIQELDRIHSEMRQVFDQLGYPQDLSIVEAYNRVAQDGGHIAGKDVIQAYQDLIEAADQNLEVAFDIRPQADVIVVPDEYGDYYISPAFDGSRPGAFYAGVGASGKEAYAMPTLAYHETIPGHHFQIALAQEMHNLPSFRQGLSFTAFAEGWALYAERLAWELGWYQDDPYGYLGFLQSQAFRAARLVVDTGLHADGWTFDQAQEFFTSNTGFELSDNVNPQHAIARYLVWPGQSTSYYVGYLKFMELRTLAMDTLGDRFDLKDFHRLVLTNGSMPLEVLQTLVLDWLHTQPL